MRTWRVFFADTGLPAKDDAASSATMDVSVVTPVGGSRNEMDEEAPKAVRPHKGGPPDDYNERRSLHSSPFQPITVDEYEDKEEEEEHTFLYEEDNHEMADRTPKLDRPLPLVHRHEPIRNIFSDDVTEIIIRIIIKNNKQ